MDNIFLKIVEREIPAHIITENDQYLAFLDIHPLTEGHTLVIPKKEVDYVFDLDHQTLTGLFSFSKNIAKAIEKVVSCKRIGVSVIGLEVPHAHVHLIPINEVDDMNFSKMKLSLSKEELTETASKIKKALDE